MAGCEKAQMDVRELVGKGVSDDQACLHGPEVGGFGGVVPDGGPALFDVDLREREGHEFDVPFSARPEAHHQMFVAVAGEGQR